MLLSRYNLDVMHIERKVGDKLVKTFLNIDEKLATSLKLALT